MSEKILTKKIAEQFIKSELPMDLSIFTIIENDAAETLAKYEGVLDLGGLEEITPWLAEALAGHKGDLFLGGLKLLTQAVAAALGKHEGDLYLGGIKTLSPESAKELAKHKGRLNLENVETLSSLAAEALSKFEGKLPLGLEELDESKGHVALAGSLAKCEYLSLPELKSLSDAAALALSKRCGGKYFTLGVERLSGSPGQTALAGAIAKLPSNSWVMLDQLTIIGDDFAEALGRRGGWLSLKGLNKLSDKAAKSLSPLKTLDISKEGRNAINKAKKYAASANKPKSRRAVPSGCPKGAFEWMRGGVLAVKAKSEAVERLAEALGLEHEILPDVDSAPWCLLNGVCAFHKPPEGYEDIAGCMADHFKTLAVHLWRDDTSGITGYSLCDPGKKKENYTTEGDFESELPDESKCQKLIKAHKPTSIATWFIDARFKQLGIPIPDKLT